MTANSEVKGKISLAEFISQNFELYSTEGKGVIAILSDGSILETNSRKFSELCTDAYFHATGEWPSRKDMDQALTEVGRKVRAEAKAVKIVDGNHVKHNDQLIFRLEDGSQYAVSGQGAEPISRADSGVHFTKETGKGYPVPAPTEDPLFGLLSNYTNTEPDQNRLFFGCIVKSFMPGPNPVMLFTGPQGSGKSMATKIFKMIADPGSADGRIQILDNVSSINGKLSDDLCRASHDRISLVTTINDQMPNQDLVDRTIVFELDPIDDTSREPETKILAELQEDLPKITWWLFKALAAAQQHYQDVELDSYPRLADLVQAVIASCPGLDLNPREFLEILAQNRIDSVERSLNQNPVSAAILDFMDSLEEDTWSGTGTALLELLDDKVADDIKKHSNWPSKPNKLSAMLNRAAPFLRTRGLDIQWAKSGQRSISLVKIEPESEEQESGDYMVEYHVSQTAANADEETEAQVSADEAGNVSVPPRSSESNQAEVSA